MVYKICDHCQARLDPGERCDCREEVPPSQEEIARTSGGNVHKDHNKKEEQHYE